jgi:hypothetical protein
MFYILALSFQLKLVVYYVSSAIEKLYFNYLLWKMNLNSVSQSNKKINGEHIHNLVAILEEYAAYAFFKMQSFLL